MRENRTSGSEGGEPVKSRLPYPYRPRGARPSMTLQRIAFHRPESLPMAELEHHPTCLT